MVTLSSHVLDAVRGSHAAGIKVDCVQIAANGQRDQVFSAEADAEGRIVQSFEASSDESFRYELEFHTKSYFTKASDGESHRQIMESVVVRISMPASKVRYHIPVMISPHSYSIWWSE